MTFKGLFQPKLFYDSVLRYPLKTNKENNNKKENYKAIYRLKKGRIHFRSC